MTFWYRFAVGLFVLIPSLGFVSDFNTLSSSKKDKIFSYVKEKLKAGASLESLQKSSYPYSLKEIRDNQGNNLMHYAANNNLLSAVELLQEEGLSIDSKTSAGITPLQIAIFRGNLSMVQFLVDHGADVNTQNNNGQNALMIATIVNNKKIVLYLLDKHPDINKKDNNGLNVLTQAVSDNNNDLTTIYIKAGVDVNARTSFNRTPLHFAVQNDNYEIVKELLDAGADVNPRDYDIQDPNTPLDLLYDQGSPIKISNNEKAIRSLLLSKGAKEAKPYYNNNISLSAIYSFGSPVNTRAIGGSTKEPVQVQYTGINLRYYISPDLSLSWTYAYGVSLDHKNTGFFMAPGGLLGLQDLFSFLQTNYDTQLHGPAKGLYYTLLGLSAILPEGISWDIHMSAVPFMSFSLEVDWARAHYIFDLQDNKPFSVELTGEIGGRLNLLLGEHFLMGFNINIGFSYTQIRFVWGLGVSVGALF